MSIKKTEKNADGVGAALVTIANSHQKTAKNVHHGFLKLKEVLSNVVQTVPFEKLEQMFRIPA